MFDAGLIHANQQMSLLKLFLMHGMNCSEMWYLVYLLWIKSSRNVFLHFNLNESSVKLSQLYSILGRTLTYALLTEAWRHLTEARHTIICQKLNSEYWWALWYRDDPQDLRFMGYYSDFGLDQNSELHRFLNF